MMHKNLDMTWPALSARSDEVARMDCVADYIGGEDLRQVTLFLVWDQDNPWGGHYITTGKEVIGVALVDEDDDSAPIEIMTRDEACEMFGYKLVAGWEEVE